MKKIVLTLLFCFICSVGWTQDWSLLDEPFDNLNDWTNQDIIGTSSQVTFDAQETLKLDSGASVGNPFAYASIWQDIGVNPNDYTIEIKVYCDSVGGSKDDFSLRVYNGVILLWVDWSSDGLYI